MRDRMEAAGMPSRDIARRQVCIVSRNMIRDTIHLSDGVVFGGVLSTNHEIQMLVVEYWGIHLVHLVPMELASLGPGASTNCENKIFCVALLSVALLCFLKVNVLRWSTL